MRARFKTSGRARRPASFSSQAPKPSFRQVPYNSPSAFLLFDIRKSSATASRLNPLSASSRSRKRSGTGSGATEKGAPDRAALVDRVFVGRDAAEADKARRIRITPLPSIGHTHAERSIRRVLVTVPPDCPIATGDVAWAFSGLALDFDPQTGEVPDDGAMLVAAADRAMLAHYGVEDAAPERLWRTVTPAALPERAARRRIDPRRMREEAKGGAERLREQAAAEWAVRQALRHAGIDAPVQAIRVQREPFEAKGSVRKPSRPLHASPRSGSGMSRSRLRDPVQGPLLIGDGRYLGLGLMGPVGGRKACFAFTIADGLAERAEPQDSPAPCAVRSWRACRRRWGARDAAGLLHRSCDRRRAGAIGQPSTPRLCVRRPAKAIDGCCAACSRAARSFANRIRMALMYLERALGGFCELRAGPAGKLSLSLAMSRCRTIPYSPDRQHGRA